MRNDFSEIREKLGFSQDQELYSLCASVALQKLEQGDDLELKNLLDPWSGWKSRKTGWKSLKIFFMLGLALFVIGLMKWSPIQNQGMNYKNSEFVRLCYERAVESQDFWILFSFVLSCQPLVRVGI